MATSGLGTVAACLRSAMHISNFCVGEAWVPTAGDFSLIAVKSIAPLLVDRNGIDVVVNLELAREFSSRHTLALQLCASVMLTRRPQWSSDTTDDLLLTRLLTVQNAVAIPVFRNSQKNGTTKSSPMDNDICAILIFFSSIPVGVSG